MNRRGMQIIAWFLIGLGILYSIGIFVDIRIGDIFWPLVFILTGLLFIFRPEVIRPENVRFYFAGDVFIDEKWKPKDEEIRMFAGDVDVDLRKVALPDGETKMRVLCFAGEVTLDIPEDVGVWISTTGFVTETLIDGKRMEYIFSGTSYKTDGYESAKKKFRLETTSFAMDIKIRR